MTIDRDMSIVPALHVVNKVFEFYPGPIPMMIGAELFRQGPRPKAMAAASVVNWVGTFIVALSFESIAVSKFSLLTLQYVYVNLTDYMIFA